VLPAKCDDKDDDSYEPTPRFVVLGREDNIQARINSPMPTFTMPVGIGYPDDGICAGITIADCIVEYRTNIGIPSKKTTIPGQKNVYLETYASIGIPQERLEWMTQNIKVNHRLDVDINTYKFGTLSNGYYWVSANISQGSTPIAFAVDGSGVIKRPSLISLVRTMAKNLIGVMCLTFSIKRVYDEQRSVALRTFGITLKSMQVTNITDLSAPKLFVQ
jgi:hypothetical protein